MSARLPRARFVSHAEGERLVAQLLQLTQPAGCLVQLVAARVGEGVSSIAYDLALIAADQGLRTLLLDLDAPGSQLARLKAEMAPLGGALRPWQPLPQAQLGGLAGLEIFAATTAPLFVSDAPGNWVQAPPRASALLNWLAQQFALVLVDAASLDQSGDTLLLAPLVSTNLIVISAEQTRVQVAEDVRVRLSDAGGRVGGLVLNRRRMHIPKILYDWI